MIILAIDLGKFNSMCCFFNTATQEHRFQAAATTRSYLTAEHPCCFHIAAQRFLPRPGR